ncbi:MAG: hypothetical protein Q4A56_07055 [Porphyromonadaceae bacterium]|nr:hypothetical protein [Porphyromonadaceae bacterium]
MARFYSEMVVFALSIIELYTIRSSVDTIFIPTYQVRWYFGGYHIGRDARIL